VGSGSVVQDSLIMGADIYESQADRTDPNKVPIGIGRDTTVRKAIVDKNARIGNNVQIINKDNIDEAQREDLGFYIRSGIVVVLKGATIGDGMVI
jgi:glucose-1-phosphate adenylyltransferase